MMLFTPGPVAVNPKIAQAQAGEMITHRGKQYQALYKPIIEELKAMLGAAEVHIMTGSGTLGIEANVQNALPAGGKALVLSNGAFGDKLKEHCQLYYETRFERLKDAQGWDLERATPYIDKAAEEGARLFCMVHHETSPGILNRIREICLYAKSRGMLTLLDGTSAWPAYPLDHEADGVDFYSWASQKAMGCPPGLAVVSHSPAAT
ncbi:MAG: aminotransferase class V-fold PLP-dependent enzyme, partial [Candidatus Micrarchaeota archaeon]